MNTANDLAEGAKLILEQTKRRTVEHKAHIKENETLTHFLEIVLANFRELSEKHAALEERNEALIKAVAELQKQNKEFSTPPLWALLGCAPTKEEYEEFIEKQRYTISKINRALLIFGFEPNTIPSKDELSKKHKHLLWQYHTDTNPQLAHDRVASVNDARDVLNSILS